MYLPYRTKLIIMGIAIIAFVLFFGDATGVLPTNWTARLLGKATSETIGNALLLFVLGVVSILASYNWLVDGLLGGIRCPMCGKWFAGRVVATDRGESSIVKRFECRGCKEEWDKEIYIPDLD